MFAPLIAKPQAKTAGQSSDKSALRRAAAYVQDWDIEQAQTSPRVPQTGPRFPGNEPPGGAWDFSKIPLNPPGRTSGSERPSPAPVPRLPGPIQRKLKVGAVDDPLEHEADRVADQVMRMPAPDAATASAPPQINRNCTACEEGEKGTLQTKSAATAKPVGGAPPIVHEVLRSPGQSLDGSTRAYFEPRFGYDFSRVRVHADPLSAESARAVEALAYTVGQHIIFQTGQYAPRTHSGGRLLAHELAHVVQHASSPQVPMLRRAPGDVKPPVPKPGAGAAPGGEKHQPTDRNFARRMGRDVAARLVAREQLSPDLRLELNRMLAFFQGAAKRVYIQAIKPALVRVTSRPSAGAEPHRGGQPGAIPQAPSPATPTPHPSAPHATDPPAAEMHIGDTNVAISLDKATHGEETDPGEDLIVETIHNEGTDIKIVHTTEFELQEGGRGDAGFEVVGRPPIQTTVAHRTQILTTLNKAGLGGPRGTQDQLIVRQALLAEVPPGTAKVFRTNDTDVIEGLGSLADPPIPEDLGDYQNVSEYLHYERGTNRFTIEVEGHSLVVQPIQPVRSGLVRGPTPKAGRPAKTRPSKMTREEKKRIIEKNKKSADETRTSQDAGETAADKAPPGASQPTGSTPKATAEALLTEKAIEQEVAQLSGIRSRAVMGKIATVGGRAFALLKVGGYLYIIYSLTQIRNVTDAIKFGAGLAVNFVAVPLAAEAAGAGELAFPIGFLLIMPSDQGAPSEEEIKERMVDEFLRENFTREEVENNWMLLHVQANTLLFNTKPFEIVSNSDTASNAREASNAPDEVMSFVHTEAAAIRTHLISQGDKRAGTGVITDILTTVEKTTDPAKALKAVRECFRFLDETSYYPYHQLWSMQDRLLSIVGE